MTEDKGGNIYHRRYHRLTSTVSHPPLQLNSCSRLAAALPYHRRLRRTPSHIADTFKRHRPSLPLNADDYCCHPPPPSPRFDCCVSLCLRRLAFVHCHRHWKTPPPSNAPAYHPVLHHTAMHLQFHSTSEHVGMMLGFLKRNLTRRWTAAAQMTGSLLAFAMWIQPPVSTQSNCRPPPQPLLGSWWFHICRGYLQGSSPVHKIPPGLAWRRRRTEVAVDGEFFWLTRCAANYGGGDVQQTTPGTLGSVGERRDGRRKAAIGNNDGSSGGGRGGGIVIILWLAVLWEDGGC